MKTVCIYHSVDLDGWMSAAIVKHWFIKNNNKCFISNEGHFENGLKVESRSDLKYSDELYFIGYTYGQPIPELLGYDRVIMCDISLPPVNMQAIADDFEGDNFVWCDHHISAIKDNDEISYVKGIRDTKFSACELTCEYFLPNEQIPEIVRLLGRYDCFGHKGTDEEQKVLEFQYGARQVISNYEEAYTWLLHTENVIGALGALRKRGSNIYDYLCTEAKQVYKNGFEITLTEQCGFRIEEQIPRKFICINKERFNPINFGIDCHKYGYDGVACFWYKDGKWNFSLYNDNGLVDCSMIAKQFGGGGHKGASGFVCDNETMLKIIRNEV